MKKNAVIYISIISSAIIVGGGAGVLVKRLTGKENIVYIGDSNSVYANAPEILKKYESYKGNNLIKDFQTWELVNVALEQYRNCEYSYSFSKGKAHTIVEQDIRNYQIKNGKAYFEESLSKSAMVAVAKRMYQEGAGENVKIYDGSIPTEDVEDVSFTERYTEMSSMDYKNYLGRTLDTMFIYAISDKTVIEQNTKKLDDGGYELFVSLNPTNSTVDYQIQMKNISNLDQRPIFEKVHLTYTVDENMMLQKLHVDEEYSAKMTLSVDIRNDIDTYYYPNEKIEIPSYEQKTSYSAKGENE